MKIGKIISLVIAIALSALSGVSVAQDEEVQADAKRVIGALGLAQGSTVADIGAGHGELTLILARHVGPTGRIYATELNRERLEAIRETAEAEGLSNISLLEGHETQTNLAAVCCDGLVVRFVYHHFANPAAMNASMRESVRPGGYVAIIDFSPRGGAESDNPTGRSSGDQHGVKPETVAKELTAAGFQIVSTEHGPPKDVFMVVARRRGRL